MTRRTHSNRIAALATDPLRFMTLCWPEMRLSAQQQDVLLSVDAHVETFVHAANKTGKTRIAAVIAVWHFFSRTPAQVIVTSSSETQLRHILWKEILHLIKTSRFPLPFQVRDLCITKLSHPEGPPLPEDYLLGHVTRIAESFQGHHLPSDKPRVLAIIDEASGVPDEFYVAAQSWAHRILVIGNPLSNDSFFFRWCRQGDQEDPAGGGGLLRKVIHIDGRDGPNVHMGRRWRAEGRAGAAPVLIRGLMSYNEYCRLESEWNEPQRETRLRGRFYEGRDERLFPGDMLDRAMDRRRWDELAQRPRRALALGIDVAAGSRDKTCWSIVDHEGVIEQIVLDVKNAMEIVGWTIRLIQHYELPASWEDGHVAIDAGGGGTQIADRLREQGIFVQTVHFGEGAHAKQAYVNRRAEMYGHLAGLFDPNREAGAFCLPPESHELRAELNILPLRSDSEGRLRLPPKQHRHNGQADEKSIRQLLGRSPDRADSLVLAAWALRWCGYYEDISEADLVYDDERPLTPEEYATMSDFLREICELEDEIAREYERCRIWSGEDWDDGT